MELYILKSSACLAIFMLFYKLVLETTSAHTFKRFYLLSSLLLAFSIPLITFTEYVEPVAIEFSEIAYDVPIINERPVQESVNYWPTVLWIIYGLGVLIFLVKFWYNLSSIISRIQNNPKQKSGGLINVLVQNLKIPHTFFSYIFLNKSKFESSDIPKEVLIHEQTHAYQKHSIDVLILELLQILLWFNPLIYLLKKDVKLNHEYLADRAVLQNEISPSAYQTTLLAFSSNAYNQELANAFNYSSIKKRFTVMKKKTPKQKIWLRSLMLLPLISITLYGFSGKKVVEKESIMTIHDKPSYLKDNPVLEVSFNPDKFQLNGVATSMSELKKDFIEATGNEQSDLDIKAVGGLKMTIITEIMAQLKGHLLKINLDGQAYIIEDNMTSDMQEKATKEQVAEYNAWAKKLNAKLKEAQNGRSEYPIVKQKDVQKYIDIYSIMSDEQRKNSEPMPIPPPPPSTPKPSLEPKTIIGKSKPSSSNLYEEEIIEVVESPKPLKLNDEIIEIVEAPTVYAPGDTKTGFININGSPHYFVTINDNTQYYNRQGFETNLSGVIVSESQVNASDVVPGQYITKVYSDDNLVAEFKDNRPELKGQLTILPPPPPISPLDHVIKMAKKGATFYYEDDQISSDKAIDLLKKNKNLNINSKNTGNKHSVYISKDPIDR